MPRGALGIVVAGVMICAQISFFSEVGARTPPVATTPSVPVRMMSAGGSTLNVISSIKCLFRIPLVDEQRFALSRIGASSEGGQVAFAGSLQDGLGDHGS